MPETHSSQSIEMAEAGQWEVAKAENLQSLNNYFNDLIDNGVERQMAAQQTIDLYHDMEEIEKAL